MRAIWINGLLWAIGLLGAGSFAYSLTQQSNLQTRMNQTMVEIGTSVLATSGLVQETGDALAPLGELTQTLQHMQASQSRTVTHLKAMNGRLEAIGQTEQQIIRDLDRLNAATDQVRQHLTQMAPVTAGLRDATGASAGQARQEAGSVAAMDQMTQQTVDGLHQLNQRFALLRALP
ncbi:hypothetical protein [Alicyclobacillus sp.]|uniref:hypothetical protein n=1 Tax=Alicyclobacillus sp. TaxID=61169 RepID=UPI0025C46555|nr:hypothetical protein [Alicyclobacillus sp.]MCL6516259.1 hypothetical protein [Alicyclobacillus sp.]